MSSAYKTGQHILSDKENKKQNMEHQEVRRSYQKIIFRVRNNLRILHCSIRGSKLDNFKQLQHLRIESFVEGSRGTEETKGQANKHKNKNQLASFHRKGISKKVSLQDHLYIFD